MLVLFTRWYSSPGSVLLQVTTDVVQHRLSSSEVLSNLHYFEYKEGYSEILVNSNQLVLELYWVYNRYEYEFVVIWNNRQSNIRTAQQQTDTNNLREINIFNVASAVLGATNTEH